VKVNQFLLLFTFFGFSMGSSAQTVSPIQSAARPYKLDIAGLVQVAGSDAASLAFQKDALPGMLKLVGQNLREYQKLSTKAISSLALDPEKLVLGFDTVARVYFVGEGAGYRNSLGYSTTGQGPLSKDAELIFPNASSPAGYTGSGGSVRNTLDPLLPGDFVDLGTLKKGTLLEFFIVSDGANKGKEYYSTKQSLNNDGIVHAISLAPNGSPYLMIGFEDLKGGGDRDYNDLVFAVFLGADNLKKITGLSAPEPSLAAGGLLALGAIFGRKRRR
jgi:Domain of unknown function (DUF4114)